MLLAEGSSTMKRIIITTLLAVAAIASVSAFAGKGTRGEAAPARSPARLRTR